MARITGVTPVWAVAGGRVRIAGSGFVVDGGSLPAVRIGGAAAQVVRASSSLLGVLVPAGETGGSLPVRLDDVPGETVFLDVGAPLATGLHQVDNPVFDAAGNLYLTFSGPRGQQTPVSVFRVRPDAVQEPFVTGIVNATSLAFDPAGRLHVSSRFDGSVYRIDEDGHPDVVASDLGIACGIAFAADGSMFVGDRSGTIFRVAPSGETHPFATLPASVAAFHLAIGGDNELYVSGPTLSSYDSVYRLDSDGRAEPIYSRFGRPQGIAFDAGGDLHVVEALAGASGVYRFRGRGSPEQVLAGDGLIGLAFDPQGGLVVCSNETAYRLDVATRPLRLW
jgi:sugar lactone lactonase YvrE